MQQITKEQKSEYINECIDYYHKSNDENTRERYLIQTFEGNLVSIEGNTQGWFLVDGYTSLSAGISWVTNC